MTSPYLDRERRSEAEARANADRDEARSGGRPNPDREYAHWHLEGAIRLLETAQVRLHHATDRLPIGSGCDDEISQIKDIISDVQTKIERLE